MVCVTLPKLVRSALFFIVVDKLVQK
jgi:hypothetical protein